MQPTRHIHAVDAPAGSGKTYQTLHWALSKAALNKQKSVFVFKSIELLQQAQADANEWNRKANWDVPIHALHSQLFQHIGRRVGVGSRIIEHLQNAIVGQGEILMITEAAFLTLQHWPNRWMWCCICDEIPAIAPAHKLNIPDNYRMLTDHIELANEQGEYSQVTPTKEGRAVLLRYAENPSLDQISDVLSSLARHIISPSFETYVNPKQYLRLKAGNAEPGAKQLEAFSLLHPSVFGDGTLREFQNPAGHTETVRDEFAQVIIMGAGFEQSLLGLIWPQLNLKFEPLPEISTALRYTQHSCGDRLTINFVFETDWSKSFRGKTSKVNNVEQSNLNTLLDGIDQVFTGPFVYLVNKDTEKTVSHRLENADGKQLPNAPWGLNAFQHIHNVAILSALNPTTAHLKFFAYMGLQGDAIREALFHSQIYQAVMRCSLRNPAATEPVRVLVPDRKSAEALAYAFPGSDVQKLPLDIVETPAMPTGRPKLAEPKSKSLNRSEMRKRDRAMDKEIKRIQEGGVVDRQLLEQFESECRGDNQRLIQLQALVGKAAKPVVAARINRSNKRTTP